MITPDDVIEAAASCRAALMPLVGGDERWETRAGDLDWTCRRTLDHIADALLLYAGNLATRTPCSARESETATLSAMVDGPQRPAGPRQACSRLVVAVRAARRMGRHHARP